MLLRAPGWTSWLAAIAEVAAEVEVAAGLRRDAAADWSMGSPAEPRSRTLVGVRSRPMVGSRSRPGTRSRALVGTRPHTLVGSRSRLLVGPPLPGLAPISAAAAALHLATAGARGLPAPLRRWTPTAGGNDQSWQAGAGYVLTCEGLDGVSAQAVVALGGAGNPVAITPPPGGALVLRAWRAKQVWGAACGLVLASPEARGLGREAGRVAARARDARWGAVVLQGVTAMKMARAGDHRTVAPELAARAASAPQVAALFEACLAAAGLGRPASGSESLWALEVTS